MLNTVIKYEKQDVEVFTPDKWNDSEIPLENRVPMVYSVRAFLAEFDGT